MISRPPSLPSTHAKKNTATAVLELSKTLEGLLSSQLQEIVLALCIPGDSHRSYFVEIVDIVTELEAHDNKDNNTMALPLRLHKLSDKQLQEMIVRLSSVLEKAYNRAKHLGDRFAAQ